MQKDMYFMILLYEMSRVGKSIVTESRLVVVRDWEKGKMGNDCQWVPAFFLR